jgi:hypothetical protein
MFKENGRVKPADPKEVANVRGKTIVCTSCGYREIRNSLEFAEAPQCPKCNQGLLHEELNV